MNKYDYGYKLHKNTTTSWAFEKICNGTEVLELGSSNGNLTKHLKEVKNCKVDIVELNLEAGLQAKQFARDVMLGSIDGDLEKDKWFEKYSENKYDYIVILDVLEHLRVPEEVLLKAKSLLKEDGSIILSVPNMAHNSVLIDLIRNKLKYNDLGILDNTHLQFFTQWTLDDMVRSCGLCAVEKHAIQIPVGSNEIKNNYSDLDSKWETLLKDRLLAEVFQFVYLLKSSGKEDELHLEELNTTKRIVKIYYKETEKDFFNEEKILFQYVPSSAREITFELKKSDARIIRIDLFYEVCILDNFRIFIVNEKEKCEINNFSCNGTKIKDNCYCFSANTPSVIFHISEEFKADKIYISFMPILYGDKELKKIDNYIQEWWSYLRFLEDKYNDCETKNISLEEKLVLYRNDLEIAKQESYAISENYKTLENSNSSLKAQTVDLQSKIVNLEDKNLSLENKIIELENKTIELENENLSLEKELENIYHSRAWKLICWLRAIKKKLHI